MAASDKKQCKFNLFTHYFIIITAQKNIYCPT